MTTKDLEKEIALATDLQNKLDTIEGSKPKKPRRKTKVSQDVVSPRDAEVNADIGELDKMKRMVDNNQQPIPAILPDPEPIAYPDAKMHKNISFVKSAFRFGAGFALIFGNLLAAGILIIIAEILGVAEEVV